MNTIELTPVPAGQELQSEQVESLSGLFDRLKEIESIHLDNLKNLKTDWDNEEREALVGFSVELNSAIAQSSITMHVFEDTYLIMGTVNGKLRISSGNFSSDEIVVFLHPEWTEFERSELNSQEFAKKILQCWLETGELDDRFLR